MFISIPEEFFVPVLFSSRFILNLENNNMEYDTEREEIIKNGYRSSDEDISESEELEEKEKVEKEIKLDNENEEEMLDEADEEYIHSQTVGK